MGGSTIGTDITCIVPPTAPTPTTICTEALTQFMNGGTPSPDEITAAIEKGLEKVKRDIMNIGKTWRPLIKSYVGATVIGAPQYANPNDFQAGYSAGLIIGDATVPLKSMSLKIYDMYQHYGTPGQPKRWTTIPDGGDGFFCLYPTPDAIYGYRQRYYADLLKVDTSEQLYVTILRRWASVFAQGVYTWALNQYDDDRYDAQEQKYQNMLITLMAHDLDGMDMERFQKTISGGG